MDLAGMNIRKITDYFRAGCKEDYNRRIGVEIEHFVIKEDNTNATYEEIAELLEAVFGNEQCEYEQRSLLGCVTMEYAISLEPAAQLEISIFPRKTVQELEQIYEGFFTGIPSMTAVFSVNSASTGDNIWASWNFFTKSCSFR